MRSIKIKFFVLTFVLLIVYLFLFYFFVEKWVNRGSETVVYSSLVLNYVVVHIDMKGSPPKLAYLESLLPMFKEFGVNGILMEYEDMFPYDGKLVNLSARDCYDRNELKTFLNNSVHFGLEIIPLVQTFGHMEHALKLPEYKHLREVSKYPESICPSKAESKELIKDMLEQVITFHTSIVPLKHIHIGCDEVFHINKCEQCRQKNVTNIKIFLNHVHIVDYLVRLVSPHTKILIWDDMLRGKRGLQHNQIELNNIEPVYWDYKPKLSVSHANLFNYHRTFNNIWIASAFKGADGPAATLPNFKNRFMNNLCWLDFIIDYKFGGESKVYDFKGIILTGWSRYSHMDPLCELLPASIPSLILNLLLIKTMKKGIVSGDSTNMDFDDFFTKYLESEFNKSVKCTNLLYVDDFDNTICSFENGELYNGLKQYYFLNSEIKQGFLNDRTMLSSLEYYSKINNLNMNNVQTSLKWCKEILKKISNLKATLRSHMSQYYTKTVIDEYVGYKIYEDETKVRNSLKILKHYIEIRSWGRRPVQSNITVT